MAQLPRLAALHIAAQSPKDRAKLPHMRKWLVAAASILGVGLILQAVEPEKVDLGVLHRIKSEAFARNSKVMDTLFYLTDVYGPRLTGSPNINDAGNWAVKKMQEWGLANVKM